MDVISELGLEWNGNTLDELYLCAMEQMMDQMVCVVHFALYDAEPYLNVPDNVDLHLYLCAIVNIGMLYDYLWFDGVVDMESVNAKIEE